MPQERIHPDEMFTRAEGWYDTRIRPLVETENNIGKLITIDIETGDYEISARRDSVQAIDNLLAKNPGTQVLQLRIGYSAVDSFGGFRLMPGKHS